jgi:hypothetical protein
LFRIESSFRARPISVICLVCLLRSMPRAYFHIFIHVNIHTRRVMIFKGRKLPGTRQHQPPEMRAGQGLREGVYHVRELLDTLAQDASEADRRRRALYSIVIHSLRLRTATDPFRQETRRRIAEEKAGRVAVPAHPRARRALRMPSAEGGRASPRLHLGHARLQYRPAREPGLPSGGCAARAGSTLDRDAVRGCCCPMRTPGRAGELSRPDTVSTIADLEAMAHFPPESVAHFPPESVAHFSPGHRPPRPGSGRALDRAGSPVVDLSSDSIAWPASRVTGAAGASEFETANLSAGASGLAKAYRHAVWDTHGRAARGGEAAAACASAGAMACDHGCSSDACSGAAEGAVRSLSGEGEREDSPVGRRGEGKGGRSHTPKRGTNPRASPFRSNRTGRASCASYAWGGKPDEHLPASVPAEPHAVLLPLHSESVVALHSESSRRKAVQLHRRRRWWYKPVAVLGGRFYSVSRGLGLQFILGKRMVSQHLDPPPGLHGVAAPPPAVCGFLVYDCAARALAAVIGSRRGGRLAAAPVVVLRVSARGECTPPAATWPSPDGAWAFRVVIPEGVALERQVGLSARLVENHQKKAPSLASLRITGGGCPPTNPRLHRRRPTRIPPQEAAGRTAFLIIHPWAPAVLVCHPFAHAPRMLTHSSSV